LVRSIVELQENVRIVRRAVNSTLGADQSHENTEIKFLLRIQEELLAHVAALYDACAENRRPTLLEVERHYSK
jgi:hypothetical protein